MPFDQLSAFGTPLLIAMAFAAVLIGFSKTSFGGLGAISAALFALGMPAKESTAAVLLLLIVGDIIGVSLYGRRASWRLLRRLIPTVLPGLLLGALFMRYVDDTVMRRTIGIVLLVSVLLQLWQRLRRPAPGAGDPAPGDMHWAKVGLTGAAAGFTTMTANAAGPVMALYLLASRIDKVRFIGTNAWFFAAINLAKTPLTAALGLFTPTVLVTALVLIPAVLVGAALGRLIIGRVTQRQFEIVTIVGSAIASFSLLVR